MRRAHARPGRRSVLLGLTGASLPPAGLWSVACAQQAAATAAPAAADAEYDPADRIEETLAKYVEDLRKTAPPDAMVEWGAAQVDQAGDHPDWVKLRSVAYESALLNAQAKIVEAQNTSLTSRTVQQLFRAGGQEPPLSMPGPSRGPGRGRCRTSCGGWWPSRAVGSTARCANSGSTLRSSTARPSRRSTC